MTLRGRLSVAFFLALLGPALGALVLFGAADTVTGNATTTNGITTDVVTSDVSKTDVRRPDVGGSDVMTADVTPADVVAAEVAIAAVRLGVAAQCHRLEVTARGLAIRAAGRGESFAVSPPDARGAWALCGATPARSPETLPAGLAVRVAIVNRDGTLTGYAYAVQPLDELFLAHLSALAGARVALSSAGRGTRLEPTPDQPLPLVITVTHPSAHLTSVHGESPRRLSGYPIGLVMGSCAVLVAALLARGLARVATRPLDIMIDTGRRALGGDLAARSGVRGGDEAGRLGSMLDRLVADVAEARRLGGTDTLTGLDNLRRLRESVHLEIERAARFGRSLGVLYLDLDHFKAVNDRYGHRAGDAVLAEFARRLRGVVREVDLTFRHGGEEFVVLLPETAVAGSLTAAGRIAEAVRGRPFLVKPSVSDAVAPPSSPSNSLPSDLTITVTVSIGVAIFPDHAATASELLDAADHALYEAKAAGRNRYILAGAAPVARAALGAR